MRPTPSSHPQGCSAHLGPASLLLLVLMSLVATAWAGVSATLDRSRVYEGDQVRLHIETDGQIQGTPDLSVLDKDFEVLGSSRSVNVRIVNGRRSETTGWDVMLQPKHLGRLTLPPIRVGGKETAPLALDVRKIPPEVARQQAERLFLEAEVEPADRKPYVQQQVLLTLRLFSAVSLRAGDLSDPRPEGDAVIERMGEDRQYQVTRNGRRYQVIERRYALFPERSGELRIPPLVFQGRAQASGSRASGTGPRGRIQGLMQRFLNGQGIADPFNDPFFKRDFFSDDLFSNTPFGDPGERVTARSKPLVLQVRPRPVGYQGKTWLPAADLTLSDSWAGQPPELHVGEPVTRTLVIEAQGLESSQLPQLTIPESPQFSVYPEQPVNQDRIEGDQVVGRSEQTFALVPSTPGKLVVPETRLLWWDSHSGRQREARLPRWEFNVLPGTGVQPASPPAPANASPAVPPVQPEQTARVPLSSAADWRERTADLWPWLVGLAVLLALVLVAWGLRRPGRRQVSVREATAPAASPVETKPAPPIDEQAAWQALHAACTANDARGAARALLDLARVHWPVDSPLDLGSLAALLDDEAAQQVGELDRSLYAPGVDGWQGALLCARFENGWPEKPAPAAMAPEPLPPLYPTSAGHP